jgi:excisionase family DNA binding protein
MNIPKCYEEDPVLTSKEVQAILKISKAELNVLLNTGQIKAFRVGRLWRIRKSDLDKFMSDE